MLPQVGWAAKYFCAFVGASKAVMSGEETLTVAKYKSLSARKQLFILEIRLRFVILRAPSL